MVKLKKEIIILIALVALFVIVVLKLDKLSYIPQNFINKFLNNYLNGTNAVDNNYSYIVLYFSKFISKTIICLIFILLIDLYLIFIVIRNKIKNIKIVIVAILIVSINICGFIDCTNIYKDILHIKNKKEVCTLTYHGFEEFENAYVDSFLEIGNTIYNKNHYIKNGKIKIKIEKSDLSKIYKIGNEEKNIIIEYLPNTYVCCGIKVK